MDFCGLCNFLYSICKMRRSLFLDHTNATKLADNTYTFDFTRTTERDFRAYDIKSAVATYNPTVSNSVTATDIAALTPWVWVDFQDKIKISPANIQNNDSITSITSKGSASIVCYAGAAGLVYSTIGSNMAGVLSTVNWHVISDTSQPQGGPQGNEASFTFVFETPSNGLSTDRWLIKNRIFRIKGSTVLKIVEDATVHTTNITLQVSTPYLCQCIWDGPNTNMLVEVINLTDNTSQTQTLSLPNNLSVTPDYNYYMSSAQSGFINWKLGDQIELKTISTPANLTVVNYLKQLYSGQAQSSTSDTPHSLKLHSEFFSKMKLGKTIQKTSRNTSTAIGSLLYRTDINSEKLYNQEYERKLYICENSNLNRTVDLHFRNPDDSVVDVSSFAVNIDLLENLEQL